MFQFFRHLHFTQASAVMQLRCGGIFNNPTTLHTYCWVCWWKNFENWSTFGDLINNSRVSCFL